MGELRISEKTTSWLDMEFYDKNGDSVVPLSITYRIDCLTTGAEIVDDTAVPPAATVSVTLNPMVNSLQDQTNPFERRRVTVTVVHGALDQEIVEYRYTIWNLGGVT